MEHSFHRALSNPHYLVLMQFPSFPEVFDGFKMGAMAVAGVLPDRHFGTMDCRAGAGQDVTGRENFADKVSIAVPSGF